MSTAILYITIGVVIGIVAGFLLGVWSERQMHLGDSTDG